MIARVPHNAEHRDSRPGAHAWTADILNYLKALMESETTYAETRHIEDH